MVDIQLSADDLLDSVNGNFLSFVVDSMGRRLHLAMVADDLVGNDVHYLSIHLLCIELDYCRNFRHIDAELVPMVT